VAISKAMSYILRHGAAKEGLEIDASGWVKLSDFLKTKGISSKPKSNIAIEFKATEDQILKIVDSNDKKRFEVKAVTTETGEEVKYIRAVQGHTMEEVKSEELLTKIEDPFAYPEVIHGTYLAAIEPIMKTGLNKMARNHIRKPLNFIIDMAIGMPGKNGVISGMRASCEVVIEVNIVKAMFHGHIPFWVSTNKVVLSEGIDGAIPPTYFRTVRDVKKGEWIYKAPIEYIMVYDLEC